MTAMTLSPILTQFQAFERCFVLSNGARRLEEQLRSIENLSLLEMRSGRSSRRPIHTFQLVQMLSSYWKDRAQAEPFA